MSSRLLGMASRYPIIRPAKRKEELSDPGPSICASVTSTRRCKNRLTCISFGLGDRIAHGKPVFPGHGALQFGEDLGLFLLDVVRDPALEHLGRCTKDRHGQHAHHLLERFTGQAVLDLMDAGSFMLLLSSLSVRDACVAVPEEAPDQAWYESGTMQHSVDFALDS